MANKTVEYLVSVIVQVPDGVACDFFGDVAQIVAKPGIEIVSYGTQEVTHLAEEGE
jgi:hypothetical protein